MAFLFENRASCFNMRESSTGRPSNSVCLAKTGAFDAERGVNGRMRVRVKPAEGKASKPP
jgi:hypothetical protein